MSIHDSVLKYFVMLRSHLKILYEYDLRILMLLVHHHRRIIVLSSIICSQITAFLIVIASTNVSFYDWISL